MVSFDCIGLRIHFTAIACHDFSWTQSRYCFNQHNTARPKLIFYHFAQASLPLVEPVAVVEAAIDDLIEDRVALERLEEVD